MLLSNLNLLATAPDGVARLRELILTLAVQGKLVAQDSKDEPASKLLMRSREHVRLQMEKALVKKEKPATAISEAETDFHLPVGWQWCRLTDTGQYINGLAFKPTDQSATGLPIIRIQNLSGRSRDFNRAEGNFDESVIVNAGDILVSWSATLEAYIWAGERGVLNQHIFRVEPSPATDKRFLYWLLKWAIRKLASSDHAHGLVMAHINRGPFLAMPVGLPPLAEQSRIVTRVEDLMRLCDALEAKGQLEATQHAQLVNTLLATLTDSETPVQLTENWHRTATHFDLLLDRPEAIDALEQTIFGLAMRGMLVAQDLGDEPATEVVKRIAERRKQTRMKSVVGDSGEADTGSFSLPQSWAWCNVEQIATVCLGGTPARQEPSYWNGPIPWVSSGEVANGRISDTKEKVTPAGLANSNAKVYPRNTVLIAMIGQGKTRGQSAILDIEACTNQNVAGLILEQEAANPDFIFLWALHEYVRTRSGGRGGAQPALNGAIVRSLKVPLPPLAEQSRIVTRVAQLRRLCADLRQRLAASQSTQAHLAEALVQGVE